MLEFTPFSIRDPLWEPQYRGREALVILFGKERKQRAKGGADFVSGVYFLLVTIITQADYLKNKKPTILAVTSIV